MHNNPSWKSTANLHRKIKQRNVFCMQCRDKKGLQSGRGLDRLYNMKLKERQDGLKELNGQLSL